MPTIPQRIARAFAVLCGQYGDVTKMAQDREQSRQVALPRGRTGRRAPWTAPRPRPGSTNSSGNSPSGRPRSKPSKSGSKHAVEITPDKQHEFATVAQAEGVSLSVARRLLRVVAGSRPTPSVATLGRATLEAGKHAGGLLEVLDEAARPEVKQGTADEIFLAPNRS